MILKKNMKRILNTITEIMIVIINVFISNDISEKFPIMGLPIISVPHTIIIFKSNFEKKVMKINFMGLYLYIPNGMKIMLSGIGVIPAKNIARPPYFFQNSKCLRILFCIKVFL